MKISSPRGRKYNRQFFYKLGGSKYSINSLNSDLIDRLVNDYGPTSGKILALEKKFPDLFGPIIECAKISGAEIIYFVREEMAQKVADVLLRRTNIGWLDYPCCSFIEKCVDIMGKELE